MPYLGDFLGLLMAEVTRSRMHADQEAIRVAQLYASDTYLKHFPVPRFRMPQLNVTVPVAVESAETIEDTGIAHGVIDKARIWPVLREVLDAELDRTRLTLPDDARSRIERTIAERVVRLEEATGLSVLESRAVAARLSEVALAEFPSADDLRGRGIDIEHLRTRFNDRLERAFVQIQMPPPRLSVLVTPTQLKDAGANVINLNLSVSEDAVEWVIVDELGTPAPRLVPE